MACIRAYRLGGPELHPFLLRLTSRGTNSCESEFEAIRANCSNVVTRFFFLQVDSCESIRASRPDSSCESLDHLRSGSYYS